MAFIGSILKKGITLRQSLEQKYSHPADLQKQELKKLLLTARNTHFGIHYDFEGLMRSFKDDNLNAYYNVYKNAVPIHDYNKISSEWWHQSRSGKKDICWPGKVKYFAMSSGTSEDTSKYIPVTKEMMRSIRRTGLRQMFTLARYDLPEEIFNKGILMLGGSTSLNKMSTFYDGDLSGITANKFPFWFQHFYKPGKKISKIREWGDKLEEVTRNAKDWDIGFIVGVPAWIQLAMEKIIDHYGLKHIHEIWPNLKVYVHGGVSFEPYQKDFERLLGKPLVYIETYLASEGFIAFQALPDSKTMRMVLNNGLFFEFIPFDENNFDQDGNLKANLETLMYHDTVEGREYALLLTTCAGAWRYLIGDTIKIVDKANAEIIITGRTKHFLSLCGEHLSVDNMNRAIQATENELNIGIREFTVAGIRYGNLFAHRWYIGCDDDVPAETIKTVLDKHLKNFNDDYKVERNYALKEIFIEKLPSNVFYDYMRSKGKEGAQNKYPRVLKNEKLDDWENFLNSNLHQTVN